MIRPAPSRGARGLARVVPALALSCAIALSLPGAVRAEDLASRVAERTLSNGLKVLVVPRHVSPTVSLHLMYRVGSVDEPLGQTGTAHLFEHMLFKGTRTIGTKDYGREAPLLAAVNEAAARLYDERGKGAAADSSRLRALETDLREAMTAAQAFVISNEVGDLYNRNGGSGLNAFTAKDRTAYQVDLPVNRIELWMALESDRMRNAVLREFYREKDVVMEERRRSYETNPAGMLREALVTTAFQAHPYGLPNIGWMSDLRSLREEDVEAFFRRHYTPDRAVAAIVGDVDPERIFAMIERWFGDIPASKEARPRVPTVEPEQRGERRVEVTWDAEPSLLIGFHKPAHSDPDQPAFDVLTQILSGGRTSRLYRNLVEEKAVAVSAFASTGWPDTRQPNLLVVNASPRAPHTPAELEQAILEELARMATEPVTERELGRAKNQLEAGFIRGLGSNDAIANALLESESVAGTWRGLLEDREAIAKVTAEDVRRVAAKTFRRENRTVATLLRAAESAGAAKGGR